LHSFSSALPSFEFHYFLCKHRNEIDADYNTEKKGERPREI
jgi:hypothetical protein